MDKKLKILYLSCHSILEADEVSLFHEMGYEIFSPGAYVEPQNPGMAYLRPPIPGLRYEDYILEAYHKIGQTYPGEDNKNHLTSEVVDNFDVVIVMHLPRWVINNWDVIKKKKVIWRTIGQSIKEVEQALKPYREQGMKIVRMSPVEESIPDYLGADTLIKFYKDPYEFGGWTGINPQIINISQAMFGSPTQESRGIHLNVDWFKKVVEGFNWKIFGKDNEYAKENFGGTLSYEDLKKVLRESRIYLYTGTQPSPYVLNFIEAWMTGIPVVAIGPKHANSIYKDQNSYEIPDLIKNGVNGFYTDDVKEARDYIQILLNDSGLAENIGREGRKSAIEHFGKDKIKASWKEFLDSI